MFCYTKIHQSENILKPYLRNCTSAYRRSKRLGYCSDDLPAVADLFSAADDELLCRVVSNSNHVLHPYLPDETNIPYQLRTRSHHITLINKTKFFNDADFIIRLLYKHSLRTSRCNHCSLCMCYLYILRVFYIIVMLSDSYYLTAIQLCFYFWLRMTTFNKRTWWWWWWRWWQKRQAVCTFCRNITKIPDSMHSFYKQY